MTNGWLLSMINRQTWTEMLDAAADGTAFHRWDWLEASSEALGATFVPLGLFDRRDLVGLVPIVVRSRGPARTANWVPYPYLGPLCPPESATACLDALDGWARTHQFSAVRLAFAPGAVFGKDDLDRAGFDVTTHVTMVVPLTGSLDDVHRHLTRSCVKEVRRATRAGVQVVRAGREDIARHLPALIAEAFASRGLPPDYPEAIGAVVADKLDPRLSDTLAAVSRATTLGVVSMLYQGNRAYAWGGGTYHAHRGTFANPRLYWELIVTAHARGCVELDLVGAPDPGIAAFKARFGAEPRPFVVASKVFKRWYRMARSLHGTATRLQFRLRRAVH